MTRQFFAFRCQPPRTAGQLQAGSRAALTQFVARDRFDKRDDASSQAWLLYFHERLGEREPVDRGEKFGHIGGQWRRSDSFGLPRQVRRAFEKERHRDLEDIRNVLQAARANAVRSLLIFLHLLEREPKPVAELLLAHSEHHPAHPDPAAHVFVDKVGGPLFV